MQKNPHIAVSYLKDIPVEEEINNFKESVSSPDLTLVIEPRDSILFAGLEWFLPTAIFAYVARPYFDSFLKEMGKDHYLILKKGLKNLGKKCLKERKFEVSHIASNKEKISDSNIYSAKFSIVSETPSGIKIKLLLQKDMTEDEYSQSVELFFNIVENFDSNEVPIGNMFFLAYDRKTKTLEMLDVTKQIEEN